MSHSDTGTVVHNIQHLQQQYNWDCGVTCVLMLLDGEQRRQALRDFHQICEEGGFGHSTWTIDLCYLLKRFNIEHCMYTSNMGVNESYRNKKYYSKVIDIDRARVTSRFADAGSAGVRVEVRRSPLGDAELVRHLRGDARGAGAVLLLVDANRLKGGAWKDVMSCFGGSYKGHYILVVGFSDAGFLYLNPAGDATLCSISARRLLHARSAAGTDDDVILVWLKRAPS